MRGKGCPACLYDLRYGITPAYAGKRNPQKRRLGMQKDHPRVCGEKLSISERVSSVEGSPPRMRGKVRGLQQRFKQPGITPAYAGKSRRIPTQPRKPRDHPRVCGEKGTACMPLPAYKGSPPRMRGKVLQAACLTEETGITPAYAGKSDPLPAAPAPVWDHPRVCGEKK